MPEQDRTPFLDRPGVVALISAVAVVLAAVISGVFLLSSGGDEQSAHTTSAGAGGSKQATTSPPPPVTSATSDSGASEPSSDVILRTLSMPLPNEGAVGLFLDEGKVSTECCGAEFNYERQDSTGRPELVSNNNAPYSTAVESATVSREDCSQAVATSPTITPIRPLRTGLLICVKTDAGTSLLQILAAPQQDGTLKISQKFWPDP